MSVSFGGFHNETATFKVTAEAEKGTRLILKLIVLVFGKK